MTVYMEVTNDEYELPVAVADTAKELAKLSRVDYSTVRRGLYKERQGINGSRYKKIEIDD